MMKRSPIKNVYRTTKCLPAQGNGKAQGGYPGRFPGGFIKWLKSSGDIGADGFVKESWWGEDRVYLCSGPVDDPTAIRVDIRPEVNPTHCEDARDTSLPNESADLIIIDPPYSKQLAKDYYGTEKYWSWINKFAKEASRIVRPGGLIITLTYEIPRRVPGCNFIAVCGIYTVPMTGHMRCLTVSRKQGERVEIKRTRHTQESMRLV